MSSSSSLVANASWRPPIGAPTGTLYILGAAFGMGEVTATVAGQVNRTANPQTLRIDATDTVLGDTWPGYLKSLTVIYQYDDGPSQVACAKEGETLQIEGPATQAGGPPRSAAASGQTALTIYGCSFGITDVTATVLREIDDDQGVAFTADDTTLGDGWYGVLKSFVMVYDYGGLPTTLVMREHSSVYVRPNGLQARALAVSQGVPFCLDTSGCVWAGGTQSWTRLSANHVDGMSFGANDDLWCIVEGAVGKSTDFGNTIVPVGNLGQQATQVSVGADGDAWVLASTSSAPGLFWWDASNSAWQQQAPAVMPTMIAVANKDLQWGVDAQSNVLQRSSTTPAWTVVAPKPGDGIQSISAVSNDLGDFLLAVTHAGVLHLFGGQGVPWAPINKDAWPALAMVSSQSFGDAWGIAADGAPVCLATSRDATIAAVGWSGLPQQGVQRGNPTMLIPGINRDYETHVVAVTLNKGIVTNVEPNCVTCFRPCFIDWMLLGATNMEATVAFKQTPTAGFPPKPTFEPYIWRHFNACEGSGRYAYSVNQGQHRSDPSVDNQPTGACPPEARR